MNHNEIHYQFIDIAGGISQDLTIAIEKVGPVDMISIFYFGDEDVWPDGDLVARKTLEKPIWPSVSRANR